MNTTHTFTDGTTATVTRMKLAGIREQGHQIGQPAPCWMTCCTTPMPAYTTTQTCPECGTTYNASGWKVQA